MRIMYAVCSWGYGHVTRSLPIIRKLLEEGHEITCVAHDLPRYMLKRELREYLGAQVWLEDVSDYPTPYTENKRAFLFKFLKKSPKMIHGIQKENDWVLRECDRRKYDMIVSDNRYGIYHKDIPSYLITHQLRMIAPNRIRVMEWGTERFVSFFQKFFDKYIVPDFEEDSLAGQLCHDVTMYEDDKIVYIGPISNFPHDPSKPKDVDGYISISGPEPQRTHLERILRPQLGKLKGRWYMTLGTKKGKVEEKGNVTIIPYMDTEERIDLMNRTKFIVSRSGYTTLMDLCMGGQRALFTPTPGQTEQEYLSEYHNERRTWLSVLQDDLDLERDILKAKRYRGRRRGSTEEAVEKAMDTFFG